VASFRVFHYWPAIVRLACFEKSPRPPGISPNRLTAKALGFAKKESGVRKVTSSWFVTKKAKREVALFRGFATGPATLRWLALKKRLVLLGNPLQLPDNKEDGLFKKAVREPQSTLEILRNVKPNELLCGPPYDLGQPYFPGMPHFPSHPPFLYSLTKRHGDIPYAGGITSAADAIAMGTHVGTHIDALGHFSCNGVFFGGRAVAHTYEHGMAELGVDQIAPIIRRGVLIDIARLEGLDALPADFEVTPDHLDRALKTEVNPGDIVLIRTGWAEFFSDARRYVNNSAGPGPGIEGARWLSARRVFAAGSDTVAFENVPQSAMAVHAHLLVDSGIHIIEVLNLEELARDGVEEFLFVAAPMNIRGATGAPVRPLAFRM